MPTVTAELIEQGRSAAGGWTRVQLAALGVAWPPMRGWKTVIIGKAISEECFETFLNPARHSRNGESITQSCEPGDGTHSPAIRPKGSHQVPQQPSGHELNALRAIVNPAYRPLRWPTRAEEAAYLKARREENLVRSGANPNENWMELRLRELRCAGKWRRQHQWGYRIFDFFDNSKGIAIEVDGREHDRTYDSYRDVHNFLRSGIVVLRVRNRNEADATAAAEAANRLCPWRVRRRRLGVTLVHRKHLVVLWRDGQLDGVRLLADTIAHGEVPITLAHYMRGAER